MKIIVTRALPTKGLEPLQAIHEVRICSFDTEVKVSEDQIIEAAEEVDAIITFLSDPISDRVSGACKKLKIVAQYAVGYDNIDVEAASRRGIVVTHTPGVLTETTADFTFALLLAVARRVPAADRYVREGRFKRWETQLLLGSDLTGKTLGIVGLGRIGSAVARRASGFGMHIVYTDIRRAEPEVEASLNVSFVAFNELLGTSDMISLHCDSNPQNHHLFDISAFKQMKSTALFINTARGPIVDEDALVKALQKGEIAGAGLDVYEHEPEIHPGLFDQDRVVLAPHLASATAETRIQMARMCSRSILAVLDGEKEVPYRIV